MTTSHRPGPGHPEWLRAEEERLYSFAAGSAVSDGFGWLDARGRVEERPTAAWITARMTHVFSLAHLRGTEGAAALADHGLAALAGPLRDAELGGWFDAVPSDPAALSDPASWERSQSGGGRAGQELRKSAYEHAFVVLAAASAAVAGRPGAADLLAEALGVVEEHFWEDSAGAVRESWDRGWSATEDYRGANSNMHCVEAFLAAADATGDARWARRALAIAERLVHGVAAEYDWRLPEHFTSDWKALPEHHREQPDHPFRPFGSTTGHLLEWARLLVHLEVSLTGAGEEVPAWLRADAVALFDHAVRRGWAADGREGFVYTLDWDDSPVVRERMHWVVVEAAMAAWALGEATGNAAYGHDYDRWWAYADRHHIDREHGGWHHELDPDNRPAGSVWPGKPDVYHAYQAVLLPRIGLAGSLAGALAGGSGAQRGGAA
ncbi:AGE family epimerase/isomerase [Nocardiopsis sp. LOL_012]|uniref:AGE family epimerase/isomerase n=1 Tax=Nocardiopsis sp. LOL_012 TaxID=3345409 RepID=UPI003A8C08BE